jgi:predicted Zn-dependent peptidase
VGLLDGLDRSHSLASRIASETVTLGRIRSLEERLEAIRGVTIADVQRVAQQYLRDDRRSVVRVVAPAEASSP